MRSGLVRATWYEVARVRCDQSRKTLMERIPEMKGVHDKTDHTVRENAYYK